MTNQTINIALFVSGNGTNCENIIRYFSGSHTVNIALVLSNNPDAYALKELADWACPPLWQTRSILPTLMSYCHC